MSEVSPETLQNSEAAAGAMEKLVEAISRSQHNYRELIDNLDLAVFTLSAEGEIRVANRRFAQTVGSPFHELIGHSFSEFVASPTLAEMKAFLPTLLRSGSWAGNASLRLAQETDARVFRCWLQAIVESERLVSVIGWARDITAQENRERSFAEFFETLHEGLFVNTPDGVILDANPALIRIFGYDSKEEFLKINFRQLYANPADRDDILRTIREKGMVEDREVMYVCKDGRQIWCKGRGYAIRDAQGRMVQVHGTLTDVTERREIEQRLREEQTFVQRLIDCYPDAMLVLDRQGKFIYANRRIEELTGRSHTTYVGRQVGLDLHPDDREKVSVHFEDFVAGKTVSPDLEFRVRHLDGSWRTFRTVVSAMVDESGNVTGVISSTRDVTKKRIAEKQMADQEKFTAMGHMLAGAAHELNNPLTAILGVGDLLRERAADDTTRRHADLVLQQARRASGIIQGLLAFSRHSPQGWATIEIGDLLKRVVEANKNVSSEERADISLEFEPDLPMVAGDVKLLTQVFQNILTNAMQSIALGKGSGSISIGAERSGAGSICVSFTDDGPGIAPENIRKVFEPFFTTKRPGGGSGLGLTIALSVIKEHGGDIKVEPAAKGTGACIRVFLPFAGASAPAVGVAPNGHRAQPAAPPVNVLAGRSVLVVDDEESIREIACEGLAAKGMVVHAAASPEAALKFFASNECDIVLCDFNLGSAKGETLFETLRAQRPGNMPRFVFMTGSLVDSETVQRYQKIGARVLQKPFPVSALASLMAEILQAPILAK